MFIENKLAVRILRTALRRIRSWYCGRNLAACGLSRAKLIPTFTHKEELETLHAIAVSAAAGSKILEVGSYLGASTCYLAAGLSKGGGRIWCVDTWENQTMPEGIRDTFEEFKRNTDPVNSMITIVRKRSDKIQQSELPGPFAIIFLDGDHSYLATKGDFLFASELLTPDGILIFHDSLHFQGVARVIGEALATGTWSIGGVVQNLCWIRRHSFPHLS